MTRGHAGASFPLNLAIAWWILVRCVNERLAEVFAGDRSASEEVTIERVQGGGRAQQLTEGVIDRLNALR